MAATSSGSAKVPRSVSASAASRTSFGSTSVSASTAQRCPERRVLRFAVFSMTDLPPALQFEGVTKRFGETLAVSDLSLSIAPASLVGLLGRNGAGKTTSINMATGLMRPTTGSILVLGLDVESTRSKSGAASA